MLSFSESNLIAEEDDFVVSMLDNFHVSHGVTLK